MEPPPERRVVMRAELEARVHECLDDLDSLDRDVLILRHFERLSNGETAQILGLREAAASKRHVRALRRLKEILEELPGGIEGLSL